MRHPNVVATAIGYYRIRKGDSWPGAEKEIKGSGERTLTNSEVRAYSWPAVLVFVEKWVPPEEFGPDSLEKMVPPTLYLPDGRTVPVCVISAPKDVEAAKGPDAFAFPLNNIGSGHPVIVTVQGREHVATIACLATDGNRVYALTNRHVTGDDGNVVDSILGGVRQRIGLAAADQITRLPFSDVYPGWPGRLTYVNLDVGLIDVDDLDDWTARLQDDSLAGQMVNLSSVDFPLALIGRHVRGCGAASGWMLGEISALFYRYKSRGGFEYVSDFFIGPRTPVDEEEQIALLTRAGDSGTLWLLEPEGDAEEVDDASADGLLRPLAIQWGANRLYSGLDAQSHSYALATNISLACDRLDLDFVRDWNLDQDDTWAAFGHFTIASRVVIALSNAVPKLKTLMEKNASIVSHPDDVLLSSEFKKMGEDPFVALADVPDFFWKHGKQGFTRYYEGPNHFADMDHPRPADGKTLLDLCEQPDNVDPAVWNDFYDEIEDFLTHEGIDQKYRGLLPFRVWQIFDEMARFAKAGKIDEFVCAAGVLTHYVADACQPLHISYLHDGDPRQPVSRTVHHRTGVTEEVAEPLGKGVHAAYEDKMVSANRKTIITALNKTAEVKSKELIDTGKAAADLTIALMRRTYTTLPPATIVAAFVAAKRKGENAADELWKQFGNATIKAMQDGTHTLAVLWESAWTIADAEGSNSAMNALTKERAMQICADQKFLPSVAVNQIGQYLNH
ncbi:hypothetical protein ELH92_08175 [Rhizobium ruizarguesonis]|uniref:S1/P1 Nuclease n=3 Tax=Rhizobium ruizarguesonis TaxID=2081791 RepID=A0AAE8QGN3_9HYPH|nr:hypothetical protein [Rhizobium ruizarguesonis]MBY5880253.1 hypothetical protein [Rhizobium leguminosarum]NKL45800.1 hypothetical protein [Rhizobium leguminosarum bv. viciae]MBY5892824.1 hypothetical protein [Rhizobium leguminosarum]NEH34951.1 hypothetical protein [Rhizobium ruizarguesonis]